MQHCVGLDVSVKETSVCIVDKAGKVMREVKVATKPVAILAVLTEEGLAIERIGLEAGPLSQWRESGGGRATLRSETQGTSRKHGYESCGGFMPPPVGGFLSRPG